MALDHFLNFLGIDPALRTKDKLDHLWQGKDLAEKGFVSQALYHWEQARSKNPAETKQLIDQWHQEFTDKNLPEPLFAAALMKLKFSPKDADLAYRTGCLARQLQRLDLAAKLFRSAWQLDPENANAFHNLAAILAKSELQDGAVASEIQHWFGQGTNPFPPFLSSDRLLEEARADILTQRKLKLDQEKAEIERQRLQAEEKMNILETYRLAQQLKQLHLHADEVTYPDLKEYLEEQLRLERETLPKNVKVQKQLYDLGLLALQHKDHEQALDCFQHLQYLSSPLPHLPFLQALTTAQQGNLDEAMQQLSNLLMHDPHYRFAHVHLGQMYIESGRKLLGTKHLLIAARLLHGSEGYYDFEEFIKLAEAVYDKQDDAKAMKYYQQIALERDELVSWSRIVNLHMRKKEFEPAAKALHEVLRISPQMEYARLKLVQLHEHFVKDGDKLVEQNKPSAALNFYKKALKIDRQLETIKKAQKLAEKLMLAEDALQLQEELVLLTRQKKQEDQSKKANILVSEAMNLLGKEMTEKAMDKLEEALEAKTDRNVYLTLCSLYEETGKKDRHRAMETKWAQLLEREESERKEQKDMARYFQRDTA